MALIAERKYSKDTILENYLNEIYLGQRSYGFAAAAQTYFGKTLEQLSVAECAMLAGLPQAPGTQNISGTRFGPNPRAKAKWS